MKNLLRLVLASWIFATHAFAQSPQFSQFYSNPLYSNPALAGDAGTPRFIANYRNQWATVGTAFQTAAFSFDTYAEDAQVGLGVQVLHDQRGSALKSDQLSGQVSRMFYLDGQREFRMIGGLQAALIFNRWNGQDLTYVSDFLGSPDPLAPVALQRNRFAFSAGGLFEYVPQHDDYASWWIGAAWHNIGVQEDISMDHQRINIQAGLKTPIPIPSFFGNYLGSDLDRQSALNLGLQVRKQGSNRQLDAGFNVIISPLIMGVWYRGMIWGPTRRDALIGTAGWAYGNILIQGSYDLPVSSLGLDTGSFELSVWYGMDSLFRFAGKRASNRRARKCLRY